MSPSPAPSAGTATLAAPSPLLEDVAAIDIGSNSFHMIVAKCSSGELVVVDRLRETVRLAAGLDSRKNLSPEACQRALECLHRFGQRVAHMAPGSVRAVGTNTLRLAHNASDLIDDAEKALGHPIETISGIEEARLVWTGVLHGLEDRGNRRLVIDIGGGSTELIVGESAEPITLDSLFMGCVSMTGRFFPDGTIDSSSWRRAEIHAHQEFEPVNQRYQAIGWSEAIGASGTIRAVADVVRAAGWSDHGITRRSLVTLRDELIAAGDERHIRLEGLSPDRRPVFAAGVAILAAAFEALKLDTLQVSNSALREGLLLDLIGRIRHEDVRDRTVSAFAARYHVDMAHAERVERAAGALLAQVEKAWKLAGGEPGRLLAWGARLHEVGLPIAHSQYHKHGEYVLAQSDLAGFSRDEQRIVATLVRSHRRKFPLPVLRQLPPKRRRTCERLCVLLRLAVVTHRSRSPAEMPVPRLSADKRHVDLVFPDGWLDTHPLTRADFEQEREYLEAVGYRLSVR